MPYAYTIEHDPDYCSYMKQEDALPWGCSIRLRSRRYLSFIDNNELEALSEDPNFDTVWLDVYEHGNIVVSPQGDGPQCMFDTARRGAVLVVDLREFPEWRDMDAHSRYEQIAACCRVYTAWANGDSICYTIYREDGEDSEVCGGYGGFWGFDEDACRREAEAEIAYLNEREALSAAGSD